jgi:hypothetical protein
MSAADLIPEMSDADLARFHANTARIHSAGSGPRFEQAASLLPLLEAELSARAARKPATKLSKAKAAKAAALAEAEKADLARDAETADSEEDAEIAAEDLAEI